MTDETNDSLDLALGDSYTKIDKGIIDSSIYIKSRRDQRSLFLTMLFMDKPRELRSPTTSLDVRTGEPTSFVVPAGWYGFVRASSVAIIERDGCDMETGIRALEALAAPDPDSRSKDHAGRRIARIDGGFVILNWLAYRDRDYTAASRMRRFRGRKKAEKELFSTGLPGVTTENVTDERHALRNDTQAVSEAETQTELQQQENGAAGSVAAVVPVSPPPLPAIAGPRNIETIKTRLATVIDEIRTGARQRLARDQIRKLQAEMIFAYWQAKFSKPRASLDDKREKLLTRRLEENRGDLSELFYVLDGALTDEWVTGRAQNARHANDGIDYIFRDRAHVEKFAGRIKKYRDGVVHPMAEKYAAIFADNAPRQLASGGEHAE